MVRVRFAPSPTGIAHIGGTRTALFNFLFAKANNGEFLLRIEDTDQKRLVKGSKEALIEILKWLGIEPTGEIVYQSERLELYKKYTQELIDKNIAFEKEGAVFVSVPNDKTFAWTDLVGNKKISFLGKDTEDFVILKSDGFPTYHLANVVDDHLMEVTHVFRGEEWISSTPKHLYLYESFGWEPPKFAHLPVILGADKTKLSKRHGAKSALDYRDEGYLKETILNYMALLGWNPGGDKEQLSLLEMVKLFKIEDINSANPIFDQAKFEWLNGVWIRSIEDLDKRLQEFYKEDKDVLEILKSDKAKEIIKAASSRMKTLLDFKTLIAKSSSRDKTSGEKEISKKLLSFLNEKLGNEWKDEELLATIRQFSKENDVSFKTIFFLMTGKESGIGILELNQIYGKESFVKNLNT
ncbi:MAG: Glutamate-tRNA ligase [Candidatus Levybacteria bacterium GW2011_GWB1_35_5]|nr:MAG: Glutamate-tRNA ligase [Candidatus Levybacteria bacterium GW2011_GWB1_35_5]